MITNPSLPSFHFCCFLIFLTTGDPNNSFCLLFDQLHYLLPLISSSWCRTFWKRDLKSHGMLNKLQPCPVAIRKRVLRVREEILAVKCFSVCWQLNLPLNTLLELGNYSDKATLALHSWIIPTFNAFYLRCVRGCDQPSAVGIVVILDRVVWRGDDTTGSFQLASAHWCYKGRHRNWQTFRHWRFKRTHFYL